MKLAILAAAFVAGVSAAAGAQAPPAPRPSAGVAAAPGVVAAPVVPATEAYVIGAGDALSIVFWGDAQMSRDVVVRSDGMITLPLINDIEAAGRTPEQLRAALVEAAGKSLLVDPQPTVIVMDPKSRQVFVLGAVGQPGPHQLLPQMTVLQLVAVAGGLLEYADGEKIVIMRVEGNQSKYLKFNYKDVIRGKNPQQNIRLKPGDTVIVP